MITDDTQRGIHDIDLELVFASNPDFIFHDSAGMESGSRDEVMKLDAFIAKRAGSVYPTQRLHLIGLVISEPVNSLTDYYL